MHLKAVKVKGLVYYSIVESVRINGKPRHTSCVDNFLTLETNFNKLLLNSLYSHSI